VHHINNALAGIISYAEFAAEELTRAEAEDPDRWGGVLRDVNAISAAGDRAASLARQLMAAARGESATTSPVVETVTPTTSSAAGRGGTVLVVDDDADIRHVVERILVGAGFEVVTAPDGTAAIGATAARPGEIDLLVADVLMPGMLVAALVEQMRLLHPGIRVILMSGSAPPEVDADGGGHGFLDKPFSATSLIQAVAHALELS
jgi:CheY-like chemotaxis protein